MINPDWLMNNQIKREVTIIKFFLVVTKFVLLNLEFRLYSLIRLVKIHMTVSIHSNLIWQLFINPYYKTKVDI